MSFKEVTSKYGKKKLIKDFIFSIENLNLEFCKYPTYDENEDEFELLFKENNKIDIPYYCYMERERNPIVYYSDIGYQNQLLNLQNKILIINKSNRNEKKLLNHLHISGFKGNLATKILLDFKILLSNIDIKSINFLEQEDTYDNYDPGEFLSRFLFKQKAVKKYLTPLIDDIDVCMALSAIHPFLILEYLLSNHKNYNLNVQLRKKKITNKITPIINVVLEGTSDIKILAKTFNIRANDIKDFFYFTNPHSQGSGRGADSNVKFFLDLHYLKTKEKFLFIFDNDIAGHAASNKCNDINSGTNKNNNILITNLPELKHSELKNIKFIRNDIIIKDYIINGQGVSIESFLDWQWGKPSNHVPIVKVSENNQGKFKNKEEYSKSFLKLTVDNYNQYDFSKLDMLIEFIIKNSLSMF